MGKRVSSIDENMVNEFVEKCLKPFFPFATPAGVSVMGPAEVEKFGYVNMEMAADFEKLKSTPYFFDGVYKFHHYTSLKSFFGIMRDQKIRMYNLMDMDDQKEIRYATENLKIQYRGEYERKWKQDGYYSLSLVNPKLERSKSSWDLWKNYGDGGHGVALELSINKRYAADWMNFALSKIYYGESTFQFINDFRKAYSEFYSRSNFSIEGFQDLFKMIHAFHKSESYKNEREIRLVHTLHGLGVYSEKCLIETKRRVRIKPDVNSRSRLTDYYELELNYNGWKRFKDDPEIDSILIKRLYPSVKISRIIFGPRLTMKEKFEISQVLSKEFSIHLEGVSILDSTLTEDFH